MRVYMAGLVGLLGVVCIIAGVKSHGSALFTALTGVGATKLDPGADPTRGSGASPPVNTGPPIGTGPDTTSPGQIPGLPRIPGAVFTA